MRSLAIAALCACTLAHAASRTDNVDVFIGTGGDGHTFPGATRPFGMVQTEPGHPGAPLPPELSVGGRLPLRGRFHSRLLAHAFLRRGPARTWATSS
ncbi:hypothetical protein [Massilia phosphatilytica]